MKFLIYGPFENYVSYGPYFYRELNRVLEYKCHKTTKCAPEDVHIF